MCILQARNLPLENRHHLAQEFFQDRLRYSYCSECKDQKTVLLNRSRVAELRRENGGISCRVRNFSFLNPAQADTPDKSYIVPENIAARPGLAIPL
jgi:hypothetical protein